MSSFLCDGVITGYHDVLSRTNPNKRVSNHIRNRSLKKTYSLLLFSSLLNPSSIYRATNSLKVIPLLIANSLALIFKSGSIFIDNCTVPGLVILSLFWVSTSVIIRITSYFSILLYNYFPIYIFLHPYIENYICRNLHKISWQRDHFNLSRGQKQLFFFFHFQAPCPLQLGENRTLGGYNCMKNEKNINPVSELLNSILDNLNTHELFQKDTLEVHLGRLDQVETNLLNVLEQMVVA